MQLKVLVHQGQVNRHSLPFQVEAALEYLLGGNTYFSHVYFDYDDDDDDDDYYYYYDSDDYY